MNMLVLISSRPQFEAQQGSRITLIDCSACSLFSYERYRFCIIYNNAFTTQLFGEIKSIAGIPHTTTASRSGSNA